MPLEPPTINAQDLFDDVIMISNRFVKSWLQLTNPITYGKVRTKRYGRHLSVHLSEKPGEKNFENIRAPAKCAHG